MKMPMIIVFALIMSGSSYAKDKEKKVDPKCIEFEKEVKELKKKYKDAEAEILKSSTESEARARGKEAERIQGEAAVMGQKTEFKSCPSFPPLLHIS